MDHVDVAVIGGGPAGLAAGRELTRTGLEHLVLERARVGESWRGRWDSFRLVTPNWSTQLPGRGYDGSDPEGFMARDEVVAYLERYAGDLGARVREGVEVGSLESRRGGGFVLGTSSGDLRADAVVVATGTYRSSYRPAAAATLPVDLLQLDVGDYRNERALPPGRVLVVGSGQSGCQIAEELHDAGREVFLACGRAPWAPRRLGGRDLIWWAAETGFLDMSAESLPTPAARLGANVLATGHGGGRDLDLRTLRERGVTLTGHFLGAGNGRARFASDLAESVAWGDERYEQFMNLVRKLVAQRGLDLPEIVRPSPFDPTAPESIDLAGFGAVLFAGGFRPDYGSLLPWPEALDALGFPHQRNGASTVIPGLYFLGVHFMRKRKSATLVGMGEDATVVAGLIEARLRAAA
ncbi:MAG: NAD(P)-binding domain-containing protein [Gaiellaceae bacterium]